jgi:hypothetical protein
VEQMLSVVAVQQLMFWSAVCITLLKSTAEHALSSVLFSISVMMSLRSTGHCRCLLQGSWLTYNYGRENIYLCVCVCADSVVKQEMWETRNQKGHCLQ